MTASKQETSCRAEKAAAMVRMCWQQTQLHPETDARWLVGSAEFRLQVIFAAVSISSTRFALTMNFQKLYQVVETEAAHQNETTF